MEDCEERRSERREEKGAWKKKNHFRLEYDGIRSNNFEEFISSLILRVVEPLIVKANLPVQPVDGTKEIRLDREMRWSNGIRAEKSF